MRTRDYYELSQPIWGMTVMPVDLKGNWTDSDIAKLI